MKKPFRGAFVSLMILTLVAFCGWAAVFAINVVFGGLDFLSAHLLAPFRFDFSDQSKMFMSIANMASYVLAAVAIAMLVVAIVAIRKKKGAMVASIILSVLGIVVGIYSLSPILLQRDPVTLELVKQYDGVINVITNFSALKGNITSLILGLAIYACAVLFFIFLILTVVFGSLYAKKAVEAKEEVEEEVEAELKQKMEEYEAASAPQIEEQVVVDNSYENITVEPVPVFTPDPEPDIEPEPEPVVEEPKKEEPLDAKSLAAMIREVVREIVKDEIAKQPKDERPENDNHSVVGATFGGPLVVQYFNGGINGVTPASPVVAPAPAPVEEKKEEPAPKEEAPKEEPVEEAKEEPTPVEEPVVEEEPAPVEEAAPVEEIVEPEEEIVEAEAVEEEPAEAEEVEEVEEAPIDAVAAKAPIIRIPFEERMIKADKEMQDNYNEIKNEIMSYGVHSRVSSSGDTFRLHRKTYVKLTIAGKSLKLYFALDPKDYEDSKMPIGDASKHEIYTDIPFVFKVKSGLSMRRCKQLIADVMAKDDLEQGEVESVNWVKEIKAELKARKAGEKAKAQEEDED